MTPEYQRDWRQRNLTHTRKYQRDWARERRALDPEPTRAAGRKYNRSHPERRVWETMIRRCANPVGRNACYRGVTVCRRWRNSFAAFLADMGPRPSPRHSIDRWPNTTGNYEPTNCR